MIAGVRQHLLLEHDGQGNGNCQNRVATFALIGTYVYICVLVVLGMIDHPNYNSKVVITQLYEQTIHDIHCGQIFMHGRSDTLTYSFFFSDLKTHLSD